ncbi:MAG: alpha amylase C-terminal domain-containing protein, partial [Collinsella intestinalis]|nr:alpha amylase C-terminal domain-containing protein [Collinsella intestinalis]
WRPGNHSLLTFSIMYAFSENFILPLSHDEVVNGKCSLIGRMPGDDWRRFAGLRTLAFYQMTHPGAKLTFMGDEIGQQIEWRYYESIEWFLAKDFDATHGAQQRFIEALNHFYTKQRGLWQNAYTEQGFEWIDANNSEQSIVSFVRHGDKPAEDLLILINFDPASYETYRVGTPREGDWELVFNTDEPTFGGSGFPVVDMASSKPEPWNMRDNSIEIAVPGLAGLVYRRRRASSYKPPKAAKKKPTASRTAKDEPKPAATAKPPKAKTPKTKAASKTRTSRAK